MRLLQDIALKIIEGEVCCELDGDIFTHVKPKDPDNIVVIAEYKGSQVAQFTNTSVRSVQITVRDRRNMDANAKIWKIYDANLIKKTLEKYICFEYRTEEELYWLTVISLNLAQDDLRERS